MKRRLLLFKSISLIVIALVMLTGITFAWFTPNTYIAKIEIRATDKKFRFEYFYLNQTEAERSAGSVARDLRAASTYTKITDSETNEQVPAVIVNMTMIPGASEYFMIDMLMTDASNALLNIDFIRFIWSSTAQVYLDYIDYLKDKLSVHIHVQEFNKDGVTLNSEETIAVKYMLSEIVDSGEPDGETFRLFNYLMSDGMKVRLFYEFRLSSEAVKADITTLFRIMNVRFTVS